MLLSLLFFLNAGDTIDLTLEQAVDYALKHNPQVEQLNIEFDKSRAQVGQAMSAFYPSLSASGYYAYITDVPVFQMDSVAVPMGQHENYSYQLSLQQVLFAWGKIYNAYRITDISRDIAELRLERRKQEIRYSVTDAFYGLLVLDELVRLTNQSLTQLKRHEDAVRKRYESGLVSQFDLLRAQVQVANLKPRVIEAENGLKLAREGFKMLLGMKLDSDFRISGELKMFEEDFNLDSLVEIAHMNRAELTSLNKVEEIACLGRNISRRANLPTVVGGARYERKKPFGFFGDEWGSNVTFNIGLQFPIFEGFKNFYRYKEAELTLKEARLAHNNLLEAITLEVKQAYFNFNAAQEAITTAKENVGQAKKAFEIIETRYRSGLAINLEYLDAQLALMQAETNYLQALKNYHTSRSAIYKTIGKEE